MYLKWEVYVTGARCSDVGEFEKGMWASDIVMASKLEK